ncbi:MAG: Hsp20/alpha crystallin family protein [Caulobacteraceae bacterium]|nr:Hsp20/alpha crystallin family protein [Caulobacteraceae bacterium]
MADNDSHRWMWGEALDVLARAERLHRQLFQPAPARSRGPSWEPPVDVLETAGEVVIMAALPGVSENALTLVIDGPHLVISGERTLPGELRTAVIHRLELPQGYFERRVPLPAGRYDQVRHKTLNGCLVVTLRKLA